MSLTQMPLGTISPYLVAKHQETLGILTINSTTPGETADATSIAIQAVSKKQHQQKYKQPQLQPQLQSQSPQPQQQHPRSSVGDPNGPLDVPENLAALKEEVPSSHQ